MANGKCFFFIFLFFLVACENKNNKYYRAYYVQFHDKYDPACQIIKVYSDSNMYYLNISEYLDTLNGYYDVKNDFFYSPISSTYLTRYNFRDTVYFYSIASGVGNAEQNYRVINKDNILIFSGNQWRYRYLYMKEDIVNGDTNIQYFNHQLDEIFNSFIFKMPPPSIN